MFQVDFTQQQEATVWFEVFKFIKNTSYFMLVYMVKSKGLLIQVCQYFHLYFQNRYMFRTQFLCKLESSKHVMLPS